MTSLSFGLELTGAGLRNNILLKKKKDMIDRLQSLKDRQKVMGGSESCLPCHVTPGLAVQATPLHETVAQVS